jgi:hypothetical protein
MHPQRFIQRCKAVHARAGVAGSQGRSEIADELVHPDKALSMAAAERPPVC